MNAEKLLAKKYKNRPFLLKEALELGVTKYQMKKLVHDEVLFRIARGVYQFYEADLNLDEQFRAATLICGKPSAICLISALDYYSLTDLIPTQTWIMVPETKRVMKDQIKVYRTRNPKWRIGIVKHKGFWITSIERTLIECVALKKVVGSQVAISALKQALSQKKTSLHDIIHCAKKLKVFEVVSPYLEALT